MLELIYYNNCISSICFCSGSCAFCRVTLTRWVWTLWQWPQWEARNAGTIGTGMKAFIAPKKIERSYGYINTYEHTIFNGMNIHKSQLFWGEQKVPGFWLIAIWQMDCKWKVDEGRLQCTYPTPFATDDLSGHQRGASRFSMGFNLAKAAQDGGFHWWLKVADSKPRTRQFWSDSM